MKRLLLTASLLAPLTSVVACTGGDDVAVVDPDAPDLLAGADFVAIPRAVDRAEAAARQAKLTAAGMPRDRHRAAPGPTFYLAIKKSVLAERWFLSAFLEQYFPGQVSFGAGVSLGTRVVSFKVQNGTLFVFDADDRHASSSVFDPDVLVEAYPLVDDPGVTNLPGAHQYVFIDPAAGLNRFDVLGDYFGTNPFPVRFEVELSFLQNFRSISDGVTYQQVFTGYSDVPLGDGQIEPDAFRGSGTLGLALRRYHEGSNYVPVELPWQEHFFRSDARLVPGTGGVAQTAAHWDIYPGMQPIEWVISPALAQLDATPAYADADLVGAVERGIEGWNAAFGFEVFHARVATATESFGQDDRNYVIFDPDPSLGYAFANWRTNPNTGEIRGASVYFGGAWVDRFGFDDDPAEAGSGGAPVRPSVPPPPRMVGLRWAGVTSAPLCVLTAGADHDHLRPPTAGAQLTAGQKLEAYVANMITHEIGHDLGLRHNFKGSLVAPYSSSVMDYTDFETRIAQAEQPGSYDVGAVRYLYGLDADLPTEPFCTDEDLGLDPDCQQFDTGADPLASTWQPRWELLREFFTRFGVDGSWLFYLRAYAGGTYDHAQHGDADAANRALDVILADVGVPLDPALLADPGFIAGGADLMLGAVLAELGPAPSWAIAARIDDQLVGVLIDGDGVRSYASRRAVVDVLHGRQTADALELLLAARATIAAELPGLAGTDATLTRDLLARIDRATSPYFE
ncbi:MAG: zinc-dependent metalloprotease [Myxococcales bacterium]|nr:zinc-dependent metalloprotease [Myxococcales bacterium]